MTVANILTLELLGIWMVLVATLESAVVAPPWADPGQNPCASEPGGWQLLYWPPDQKCYRIFQKGYPCPESMELTPSLENGAECRCPPGTAQSPRDALCHPLYLRGPCGETEYFAPVSDTVLGVASKQRWGVCLEAEKCPNDNHVFWPRDGKCYVPFSKGPCPDGQLIAATSSSLGECQCERSSRMARYFWHAGTCHEHYTPGPCLEHGTLFLPGGKCGCHTGLQQYHPDTGMCYQLGTVGPCPPGHQFVISTAQAANNSLGQPTYAKCRCKEGHVRWTEDGICYRPYTRGPCQPGFMYSVNNTQDGNSTVSCVEVPCSPGKLYFPGGKGCHRVGTQGPCPPGQVVLFQESVKTSVEGISYRGMCGCPSNTYDPESFYPSFRATNTNTKTADSARCPAQGRNADNGVRQDGPGRGEEQELCRKRGTILWQDRTCIQLYTQGPCGEGEWVVPDRGRGQRKGRGWKMGKCECRPGFTITTVDDGQTICQPPTVYLASFLNRNQNFNEPIFTTELPVHDEVSE